MSHSLDVERMTFIDPLMAEHASSEIHDDRRYLRNKKMIHDDRRCLRYKKMLCGIICFGIGILLSVGGGIFGAIYTGREEQSFQNSPVNNTNSTITNTNTTETSPTGLIYMVVPFTIWLLGSSITFLSVYLCRSRKRRSRKRSDRFKPVRARSDEDRRSILITTGISTEGQNASFQSSELNTEDVTIQTDSQANVAHICSALITKKKVLEVKPLFIENQIQNVNEPRPCQPVETNISLIGPISRQDEIIQNESLQATSDRTLSNGVLPTNQNGTVPTKLSGAVPTNQNGVVPTNQSGVVQTNQREAGGAQGSDREEQKNRLDWNKIFKFLAKSISPQKWKFFFIELFSHGQHLFPRGMDINSIIEQKESERKGHLPIFFFDLFIEWRRILGTDACPKMIEASLVDGGDNIVLHKFKDFMSDPPLVPESPSYQLRIQETEALKPLISPGYNDSKPYLHHFNFPVQLQEANVMALYDFNRSGSCTNSNSSGYLQSRKTSEIAIRRMESEELSYQEPGNPPGVSGAMYNHGHLSSPAGRVSSPGRKMKHSHEDSTSSDEELIPCKCRKIRVNTPCSSGNTSEKRNRRTVTQAKTGSELFKLDSIGWDFMIELIKKLFESNSPAIGETEYNLFVQHTISTLMKDIGETKESIVSILVEDYENKEEYETKRGHVTFLLDTEDKLLHLRSKEWECLKFYVEKPRAGTIERQLQTNDQFVDSRFLFIDYFGEPLLKKSGKETQNCEEARENKEGHMETIMKEDKPSASSNEEITSTYQNLASSSSFDKSKTEDDNAEVVSKGTCTTMEDVECGYDNPDGNGNMNTSVNEDPENIDKNDDCDRGNDCDEKKRKISVNNIDDCDEKKKKIYVNNTDDCEEKKRKIYVNNTDDCDEKKKKISVNNIDDCEEMNRFASKKDFQTFENQSPDVDKINKCPENNLLQQGEEYNDMSQLSKCKITENESGKSNDTKFQSPAEIDKNRSEDDESSYENGSLDIDSFLDEIDRIVKETFHDKDTKQNKIMNEVEISNQEEAVTLTCRMHDNNRHKTSV